MARGDVVADVVAIGTSTSVVSRPDTGDEWVIKCVAGDNTNDMYLDSTDGSTITPITDCGQLARQGGMVTIPITRDHYIQVRNGSGSTSYQFAYFGIKTKE